MSRLLCQDHPGVTNVATEVRDARPGAVLIEATPFFPGGGGQLPDRGILRWTHGEIAIQGFEERDGALWHLLAEPIELSGPVEAVVEQAFRQSMRELHTDLHIVNALVFQEFDGALVTGAQMNDDGTARVDFDLPAADNDRLRALEPALNEIIRRDMPVRVTYVTEAEAAAQRGLLRSRSVAPPPSPDGLIRVVEIVGLDRQACGGTHLASTGGSHAVRILKIDNKGRHNRRIRIGLAEGDV